MMLHKVKHHIHRVRNRRKKKTNINFLITASGIILVWRGIWGMMDLLLFPKYQYVSFIVSILLGVSILWLDDTQINELTKH